MVPGLLLTCGGLSFWMKRSGMKNPLRPLLLLRRFFAALLLTCCGASVPRYDSAFHLAMSEVRAKHFRQDTANSKNLTLCNQKHRLFLYLLGKCFAPTNPAESLGNRTPYQFPVPSSQLIHVTVLIIHGASHGSVPRNDNPFRITISPIQQFNPHPNNALRFNHSSI